MQYTHPNYNALVAQAAEQARRMGMTPEQAASRGKALRNKEEEDRLRAMDPNKSKSMSPEEKNEALNAFMNRRFREYGIGHVPGEGYAGGIKNKE
jgi:hypothetical protein